MAFALDGNVFDWEPDAFTPPEQYKPVALVETYIGSDVFEWPALLSGQEITLNWDTMKEAQYQSLYTSYLKSGTIVFSPGSGTTYNVIFKSLSGSYFDSQLTAFPYRKNVKAILIMRSIVA